MICCLNGKFIDTKDAKISILDNGFMFGDAFFDTMRVFNGVVLELEAHLERIEKTAKILHIKLPSSKQLESWIKKTPKLNKLNEARIRVTISRGANGFDFFTSKNPTIAITCDPYMKDEEIVKNGVSTFTSKAQRPWPEIKTTNMIYMIQAHYEIVTKKGYEAILIDDLDNVIEGSFMNLFMIKNEEIITPKDKILAGVIRDRVSELAKKMKLKIKIKNFNPLKQWKLVKKKVKNNDEINFFGE